MWRFDPETPVSAGNADVADDAVALHGPLHSANSLPCQGFPLPGPYGILGAMSRDLVNAICATFPGADVSDPWGGGHDAWKVGGKMFACIGAVMPGVSVKTDSIDTAEMLIAAGVAVKAPYFHRSWVNLPWGTETDELRHRLLRSYAIVRGGLPKKVQAGLGPLPPV